ncbi:MAG: DUF1848 domain-containing protein [Candidatus Aminicenantes bacterium]|nr:DUF1848 domain-containing protein [Candidatus Aminicenantes bacterium]
MKKVISASRRTDLVAFFPAELAEMLAGKKARVYGPSGHTYNVDLDPENVHSIVLWSKNYDSLINNRFRLKERLEKYNLLYCHFTITGLGGSFIENGAPSPQDALHQLDSLIEIVGRSENISVRFDPIVFWETLEGERKTNLDYFETLAPILAAKGIRIIRFSFAQWYNKAKRRASKTGFIYVDPSLDEKKIAAAGLVSIARKWNLFLSSCSQKFLTEVPGINPSSCIDGTFLQSLHPQNEKTSLKKDKSQRSECGCTESVDIGSYAQSCPHSCLYCYANPKVPE